MPGIARLNKHLIAYTKKKRLRRERTNRGRWKNTKQKYEAHEEKCIVFPQDGSTQFTLQIGYHLFFFFSCVFNASIFFERHILFLQFFNKNVALAISTIYLSDMHVQA